MFVSAKKYFEKADEYRLGRSSITDPRAFTRAEGAANRTARQAQATFNSAGFKAQYARLPKEQQSVLRRRYAEILKVAASMRIIGKRDRLQHAQTPHVLARRTFNEDLITILKRPNGKPFAVGMLDLDNFKRVNTKFGYPVGDAVLELFSRRLKKWARAHGGFVARVGGEEFQFYLPVSLPRVFLLVENFRKEFEKETRNPRFVLETGLTEKPKKWRSGLRFSAAVTGTDSYDSEEGIRPLLQSLGDGVRQAKKVNGKGATLLTPWGHWKRTAA